MKANEIAPIIISTCALGLTFYGLMATRRHNRLSVTPHLNGCVNKLMTDDGFLYSYEVSNNGIGPAKIKSFEFFLNGKPFLKTPNEHSNHTEAMMHEVLGKQVDFIIKNTFYFGTDTSLKAGDSRRIAEVFFPEIKTQQQAKVLLDSVSNVKLLIQYESIYGKKFRFDSDK